MPHKWKLKHQRWSTQPELLEALPHLRGDPEAETGKEGTAQFPQLFEQNLTDPGLQWVNQPDTTQVSSPHFPAMETEAGTSEVAGCGWIQACLPEDTKLGF